MSQGRYVIVGADGNVEKALRKLKKKVQNSNVLQDLRLRECYIKPTTQRKMSRNQARLRWKKYLQSQQLPPKLF